MCCTILNVNESYKTKQYKLQCVQQVAECWHRHKLFVTSTSIHVPEDRGLLLSSVRLAVCKFSMPGTAAGNTLPKGLHSITANMTAHSTTRVRSSMPPTVSYFLFLPPTHHNHHSSNSYHRHGWNTRQQVSKLKSKFAGKKSHLLSLEDNS